MSKYLELLITLVVGSTFLVSGIIKLNDPLGFSYKIQEYLHLLTRWHTVFIRYLLPHALVMAVGIAILEALLGTALCTHWQYLWTLWALLLLTLFFTFLTLYTALSKRLTNCGCFGEVLVLSPWQSFAKSGFLLVLLAGLWWQAQHTPTSLSSHYWMAATLLCTLGYSWYTLRHLPILEHAPYKIGSDLKKATMATAASSISFSVWCGKHEVTQNLLKGKQLCIIAQTPLPMPATMLRKLHTLLLHLASQAQPVLFTPMGQHKTHITNLPLPHYTVHPLLLREMLRAPWGLLLLQEGIVINKWHMNDCHEAQKALCK